MELQCCVNQQMVWPYLIIRWKSRVQANLLALDTWTTVIQILEQLLEGKFLNIVKVTNSLLVEFHLTYFCNSLLVGHSKEAYTRQWLVKEIVICFVELISREHLVESSPVGKQFPPDAIVLTAGARIANNIYADMTIVVGSSGSGNRYFGSLIERSYVPNKGQVLLCILDTRTLHPSWLIYTILLENNLYGLPNPTITTVEASFFAFIVLGKSLVIIGGLYEELGYMLPFVAAPNIHGELFCMETIGGERATLNGFHESTIVAEEFLCMSEAFVSPIGVQLMNSTSKVGDKGAGYLEIQQWTNGDAYVLLPGLATGIVASLKFKRIDVFEFNCEAATITCRDIPLYHGWWVVDLVTAYAFGLKLSNMLVPVKDFIWESFSMVQANTIALVLSIEIPILNLEDKVHVEEWGIVMNYTHWAKGVDTIGKLLNYVWDPGGDAYI